MIDFTPRPYQEAGINLMLASKPLWLPGRPPSESCLEGSGLLLEPGSGKTVVALTAADILMNERWTVEKTLVVAPKMVAQEVWAREAAKWKHTAHLKTFLIDAPVFDFYQRVTTSAVWGDQERVIVENDMTPEEADFLFCADVSVSKTELMPRDWRQVKEQTLANKAQIHIVGRDHFVLLARLLGKDWPYGLVLGDESTMWKNLDSKRSKMMNRLRKEERVQMLTLMSGTPSPKGIENLYAQALLLDGGRRLGPYVTKFRERYMVPDGTRYDPKARKERVFSWRAKPGAQDEVTSKLADICLAVRADVWRKTEPPLTVEREIELPAEVMVQYRQLELSYHLELDNGADVTAPQAAVLGNKLIQMASGAVFDADGNWHELHTAKLDALDELLEELDGEPLLLVYWFKPTLARLKARYGTRLATPKTKGFIDLFAAGKLPILAVQPGSAGHGLDGLQHGGHHVAVLDLFHDWEPYQQVVSRLDRSGQEHRVTVHQFIAVGTKDGQVARVLADRGADQGRVMDALKWRG